MCFNMQRGIRLEVEIYLVLDYDEWRETRKIPPAAQSMILDLICPTVFRFSVLSWWAFLFE
jgi:hypothetical protein